MDFKINDLKNFLRENPFLWSKHWLHLHGDYDYHQWRHDQSEPHNISDESYEFTEILAVCYIGD